MKFRTVTVACAALLLSASQALRADVQARLNVVVHALASAPGISLKTLSVAAFTEADSGARPAFAATLEADLRQALGTGQKKWTVLAPGVDTSGADGLLTGTFERVGGDVQVHVQLQGQDGTVLWQRNAILDGDDVDPSALPAVQEPATQAPAAEGAGYGDEGGGAYVPSTEEQVIPTLPRRRRNLNLYDDNFHVDFSIAYKAFFPTNSSLQNAAGDRYDGVSLGFAFNDIFLLDFDFWNQGVSGNSTLGSTYQVQSLSYAGTDLALVYPIRLGPFTLYLGPGGRFGEISVNTTTNNGSWDGWGDQAGYGNNALTAVGGLKFTADHVGLDLRYTYDLVDSYTGYNTARIGAFYEFGR